MQVFTDLFDNQFALADGNTPNDHAKTFLNGIKSGAFTLLIIYEKQDEAWSLKLAPFLELRNLPFYGYEEENAVLIYTPIPQDMITQEHKDAFRDFIYKSGILPKGKVIAMNPEE